MAIRSGDIQSTWYRVEETGRLKTLGKALPSTGNEKGNKINKITNRDVSNVAEAFVMALKRISSISKAEKE